MEKSSSKVLRRLSVLGEGGWKLLEVRGNILFLCKRGMDWRDCQDKGISPWYLRKGEDGVTSCNSG